MKKKSKFIGLVAVSFLLAGCAANCRPNNINPVLLNQSIKKAYTADAGTSGTATSNYHTSGYPSDYGQETHHSDGFLINVGSDTSLPSDISYYHDTGVRIYGNNTKTNIGSTNTIHITESCPYVDLTEAHWMIPPAITSVMASDGSVGSFSKMLLDFKVEIYNGSSRRFIAEAKVNMDSSYNVTSLTYNKNGTTTSESYNSSSTTWIDPTKLGKIPSTLYSGTYSIKVTYSYMWIRNTGMSNLAIIQETATNNATLIVDYTNPIVTGNLVGSNLSVADKSYVSSQVKVTSTDQNHNYLYYKTPDNPSSYYVTSANTYQTGTTNGWYYFYSTDKVGNKSNEYSFCIDTVGPSGQLYANGVAISSGNYINSSFSYSVTDGLSGLKNIYYKTPASNSYAPYASGSIIPSNSGDGWYYFYATDAAGNTSDVLKVFLETSTPTVSIKRNDNVSYTHSITKNETVDTGLYFNPDDTIQFDYSSSSNQYSTGRFSGGVKYTLRASSYPNNTYTETIITALGMTVNYKFSIVRNKPTITLNGTTYANGSTIRINQDANVLLNIDSVIQSGSNTATITKGINTSTYDLLKQKEVKLVGSANKAVNYALKIIDAAGNVSDFNVIIDEAPAEGEFVSGGIIVKNGGYTNKPFTFSWSKTGTTATVSKDGGAAKAYAGEVISEDGVYVFVLRDSVGNVSEFKLTLDTVAPTAQIYVDNQKAEDGIVTNKSVYLTWDGEEECLLNGEKYEKNTIIQEEGVYTFLFKDKAGNSNVYHAEIDRTAPSGNESALKADDRYSMSRWYEVSFKGQLEYYPDYDSALDRAVELEKNNYVEELQLDDVSSFFEIDMVASNGDETNHDDDVRSGTYWLYKSIANPEIKLYYFDQNLLNEALRHYSENYVSGPHYFDGKDAAYGSGISDPYWVMDGIQAPVGNGYVLTNYGSKTAFAKKNGSDNQIPLEYGKTLGEQLTASGVYEITETDEAGNSCTYSVIIDKDKPELQVRTETYSGEAKEFRLSEATLPSTSTYYLKSFFAKEIFDADPWAVISVSKDGKSSYFTKDDVLPHLDEGGKYDIKVYDRVGNEISFTVYISSQEENITFTNNCDDTAVSIDIGLTESNQTITSLEIYRNGEKLAGVSADKLNYEFTKDGTYKVVLKDNFGRTVEKEYVFHKALPTGNLLGVENGGRTAGDVSFEYDANRYYAEILKDGQPLSIDRSGRIDLEADATTSGEYQIILINLTDDENRQVYSFTIDAVSPDVDLEGVSDGGTTNGSVTASWEDNDVVSAKVYFNDGEAVEFPNGETFSKEGAYTIEIMDDLGNKTIMSFTIDKTVDYEVKTSDGKVIGGDATTSDDVVVTANEEASITVIKDGEKYDYEFGEVLTEEGKYLITVEDKFGNKTSLTIAIDKSVSFDMNVADGGITNDPVAINPGEKETITVTKDGKAYSYTPGEEITEEGAYKVVITDAYGNTKEVSFQIVYADARTSIDYELGEDVTIVSITKDGTEVPHEGNHLSFEENGTYVITYEQDGKTYDFSLSLDTTAPELTLNGVEDGSKVDGKVSLTDMTEEGEIHVYKDGVEIDYSLGQELVDYGSYKVVVRDSLGNERTYSFTLAYQMNGWGIALIVIGSLAVIGTTAFLIFRKKRAFSATSSDDDDDE
jgi:hypothetical protein